MMKVTYDCKIFLNQPIEVSLRYYAELIKEIIND